MRAYPSKRHELSDFRRDNEYMVSLETATIPQGVSSTARTPNQITVDLTRDDAVDLSYIITDYVQNRLADNATARQSVQDYVAQLDAAIAVVNAGQPEHLER